MSFFNLFSRKTPEEIFAQAESLFYGEGCRQNIKRAKVLYRRAARHAFFSASLQLGRCALYGIGGRKDPEEALLHLRYAAAGFDMDALRELAQVLKEGELCPRDLPEAILLLDRARSLGYRGLDKLLAAWRAELFGEQIESIQKAYGRAEGKEPDALFDLGLHCLEGRGIEADPSHALPLMRPAADAGNTEAQYRLGMLLMNGGAGVRCDERQGEELLISAAKAGHVDAILALADFYRTLPLAGEGKRLWKIVSLYRLAAREGSARAMHSLGDFYAFEGPIFLYSGRERYCNRLAVRWYRAAARRGHLDAMCELGDAYLLGDGVRESDPMARKWYLRAARAGSLRGMLEMGHCARVGYGMPIDYEESARWYRPAAFGGLADGQYEFGKCLKYGIGIEKNIVAGRLWLKRAAAAGHKQAAEELADDEE